MSKQPSSRDTHQIWQYSHDEESNSIKVKMVDSDIKLNVKIDEDKIINALKNDDKPLIVKETQIEKIEVPVIVKEIEIKEIKVPTIIKETEIKIIEINKPIVMEKLITHEIEKPIIIEKLKEVKIELPQFIYLIIGLQAAISLLTIILLLKK